MEGLENKPRNRPEDKFYCWNLYKSHIKFGNYESTEGINLNDPLSPFLKEKFKRSQIYHEKFVDSNQEENQQPMKIKEEKEEKKESQVTEENKNLNNNTSQNDKQIINFKDKNGNYYVLKRLFKTFAFKTDPQGQELIIIDENILVKTFVNNCLKEYFVCKLVSSHPAGTLASDFSITFIKPNLIVFELVMEKKGDSLDEYYFKKNTDLKNLVGNSFKRFSEVVEVMDFMERRQIAYGDLKLGNLVLDQNSNSLKLIDYGSSILIGFSRAFSFKAISGIPGNTPGYCSPELKQKFEKCQQLEITDPINPWISDIYSCGILGLIFSGAIKERGKLLDLENYKGTIEDHSEKINELIRKSKWENLNGENDSILTDKMRVLILNCLDFNPSQRINFKKLNKILKNIQNMDITDIDTSIKEYVKEGKIHMNKQLKIDNEKLYKEMQNKLKENQNAGEKLKEMSNTIFGNLQKERDEYKTPELYSEINTVGGLLKKMKSWNSLIMLDYDINRSIFQFKSVNQLNPEDKFQEIPNEITDIPRNINNTIQTLRYNNEEIKHSQINIEIIPGEVSKHENHHYIYNTYQFGRYNDNEAKHMEEKKEFEKDLDFKEEIKKLSTDRIKHLAREMIKSNCGRFFKQDLSKNDILIIFDLVKKSSISIKKMNFYGNKNFDEECASKYFDLLNKFNSFEGIDLYDLNISPEGKISILKLFSKKYNLKYLLIDKHLLAEEEAQSFANGLNLELNDSNPNCSLNISRIFKILAY